jgi:hypothetical protein
LCKKITGHPLRNGREQYAQIEAMKGELSIRRLGEALGVSTQWPLPLARA